MSVHLQQVAPADIEKESFRIIESELGPTPFDPATFSVVRRVIHATGDFSFADNLRFHPLAIETGINALRSGKHILTDVTMAASGISKNLLGRWGGTVRCFIGDTEVATLARNRGVTRSEMAMSIGLTPDVGIVAIGNAPTALLQIIRALDEKNMAEPPLVIGVPVGFVNAAESKELLSDSPHCYITSLGRKGGSPVAAAIVNALLHLAAGK
jgi:precorrin-8X/cobalt-precorrin-8 methylmutase